MTWRERVDIAMRVKGMTREQRAAAMPESAAIVRAFSAEFSVVEVSAIENNLSYQWIKKG